MFDGILDIGPHRVRHGDVMAGLANLMGDDKASIFYSDPPWGQGALTYFLTLNTKQTGASTVAIEHGYFLNQIFNVAHTFSEGLIFIEYGQRWRDEIKAKAKELDFEDLGTVELLYKTGGTMKPLDLHIFANGPYLPLAATQGYRDGIHHSNGMATLRAVVGPVSAPGKIILDPTCGMGYTAQIALDTGMYFRGNEINSARLAKTVARLEKGINVRKK